MRLKASTLKPLFYDEESSEVALESRIASGHFDLEGQAIEVDMVIFGYQGKLYGACITNKELEFFDDKLVECHEYIKDGNGYTLV